MFPLIVLLATSVGIATPVTSPARVEKAMVLTDFASYMRQYHV